MNEALGSHDNGALEALGLAMKTTPRLPFFLFIMCGERGRGAGAGDGSESNPGWVRKLPHIPQ